MHCYCLAKTFLIEKKKCVSVWGEGIDTSSSQMVGNCPVWVLVVGTKFESCERSANTLDSRTNHILFSSKSLSLKSSASGAAVPGFYVGARYTGPHVRMASTVLSHLCALSSDWPPTQSIATAGLELPILSSPPPEYWVL